MFSWISPLQRQRTAYHTLMGHFPKCGSLGHAEWLSLSAPMQLSACLSRKCFSQRYDYSRPLSKFFCASSFKQCQQYMCKDSERKERDIFSSSGRAGGEVTLPVQPGHQQCFLSSVCKWGGRGVLHVLCMLPFEETALGAVKMRAMRAVGADAFLPAHGHAPCWPCLGTRETSLEGCFFKAWLCHGRGRHTQHLTLVLTSDSVPVRWKLTSCEQGQEEIGSGLWGSLLFARVISKERGSNDLLMLL